MKSVVCVGVASGVSWEDAKEGRCALEEQVKEAAPWCTCLGIANSPLVTRGVLQGSWQPQSAAAASREEQC